MKNVLGHFWCFPMTLVGVLVAYAGGGRFLTHDSDGVLYFEGSRGLLKRFFDLGYGGFCIGGVIVFRHPHYLANTRLVRHEKRHFRQFQVLGCLMPLAYGAASLVALARGGEAYWDNWFEEDARAAE